MPERFCRGGNRVGKSEEGKEQSRTQPSSSGSDGCLLPALLSTTAPPSFCFPSRQGSGRETGRSAGRENKPSSLPKPGGCFRRPSPRYRRRPPPRPPGSRAPLITVQRPDSFTTFKALRNAPSAGSSPSAGARGARGGGGSHRPALCAAEILLEALRPPRSCPGRAPEPVGE